MIEKKIDKVTGKESLILSYSSLSGQIVIPPSKSHSIRALFLASLCRGTSQLSHLLHSPDIQKMIEACRLLGANIEWNEKAGSAEVTGVAGEFSIPEQVVHAGNSGLVLRFITAISALTPGCTVVTGDHSVRHLRPMQDLLHGLEQLGAAAFSTRNNGYAPVVIRGPWLGGKATIRGNDSQPVSALLFASAFSGKSMELEVTDPGEIAWVGLTTWWLQKLGVEWEEKVRRKEKQKKNHYWVRGKKSYPSFHFAVPGDWSSAAFPLIAAVITRSSLTIHNVEYMEKPIQGDQIIVDLLLQIGVPLSIDQKNQTVTVEKTEKIGSFFFSIQKCVDALPILTVLACFAESGYSEIHDAAITRQKESDRLYAITHELKKMGARIEETDDRNGLRIYPSRLRPAEVESHGDHRIALSLAVAALGCRGKTPAVIRHTGCIAKSYPSFVHDFSSLLCKRSQGYSN